MDTRIYGPKIGRNDYGVYATRRYPKGGVVPSNPSDINARAPLPVSLRFNSGGIAPHVNTIRATYTVPSRRRAVLQNALVSLRRAAAPGVAAAYTGYVILNRANGSGGVFVVYTQSYNANPNSDPFAMNRGDMIDLYEGDSVSLATEDTSTGGTVAFTLSAALIEYNAEEAIVGSYSAELTLAGTGGVGGIAGGGANGPRQFVMDGSTLGGRTTGGRVATWTPGKGWSNLY